MFWELVNLILTEYGLAKNDKPWRGKKEMPDVLAGVEELSTTRIFSLEE